MPQLDPSRIPTYPRTFADAALQHTIEQFLYLEAELLDDRKVSEWVALTASDIQYSGPIGQRDDDKEKSSSDEATHVGEDKPSLERRARESGTAVGTAEVWPVATRRTVSNVRIKPGDTADTYKVRSNLVFLTLDADRQQAIVSGTRFDVLRCTTSEVGFEIVRRKILLDQTPKLLDNAGLFL